VGGSMFFGGADGLPVALQRFSPVIEVLVF
jgi:hypothetical protein